MNVLDQVYRRLADARNHGNMEVHRVIGGRSYPEVNAPRTLAEAVRRAHPGHPMNDLYQRAADHWGY